MTTSEVALLDQAVHGELMALAERDVVDGWKDLVSAYAELAAEICDTEFVPKAMRGSPATVTACWLAGRELGIGPMTALKHIAIVHGTPTLSAEYKRARVLGAGHELQVIEHTTVKCTVRARRRGGQWTAPLTYTINDAKTAKLVKPDGAWVTRPRRMLFARATSELMDMLFPDVTLGFPTTELAEDGDWRDGEFTASETGAGDMPSAAEEAPAPVQRRTRRKPAEKPAQAAVPEADGGELETQEEQARADAEQAEDDVFDEPAGGAGGTAAENADGSAIAGKMSQRRIEVLFGELTVAEASKTRVAEAILGRPVQKLSGLSQDEASRLLDVLAAASRKDDKRAALKRMMREAVYEREAAAAGDGDDEGDGAPF